MAIRLNASDADFEARFAALLGAKREVAEDVEATARGLRLHQMGGIDADALRKTYEIPEGFSPVSVIAIGVPGEPDQLPDELVSGSPSSMMIGGPAPVRSNVAVHALATSIVTSPSVASCPPPDASH